MRLSWSRWVGIIVKEFIQLKRDRLTFGMIIGIPVLQLILFGYAINADPKRLPTAVLQADSSPYSRTLLAAMQTSGYFRLDHQVRNEHELENLLAQGRVQFAITIPENFSRKLVRGERPVLLVEADASDPAATGNAMHRAIVGADDTGMEGEGNLVRSRTMEETVQGKELLEARRSEMRVQHLLQRWPVEEASVDNGSIRIHIGKSFPRLA